MAGVLGLVFFLNWAWLLMIGRAVRQARRISFLIICKMIDGDKIEARRRFLSKNGLGMG